MDFLPKYEFRKKNGVYIIKNLIDSRVYIGQATNFYKRFGRHVSQLLHNKHYNKKLQSFVNKHGIDALVFDILEIIEDKTLFFDREIFYIDHFNSVESGFNIVKDSRTMNWISSTRRKENGLKNKGRKLSKEWSDKISFGLKLFYIHNPHHNCGKKYEKERIRTMSDAQKRRVLEGRNKLISLRLKGNDSVRSTITEETASLIKADMLVGIKRRLILAKYKITVHIYKDIQRGKTWAYV